MVPPAAILIIDDEPSVCAGCRLVLSDQGHTVDMAHDGRSGLESLAKNHYELVLLDMKLPDIDGIKVLEVIHRETPKVSVVVMTGYSSVSDAVKAMKLGAFDYLSKPSRPGGWRRKTCPCANSFTPSSISATSSGKTRGCCASSRRSARLHPPRP